jgi:uncharacterized membrane protein
MPRHRAFYVGLALGAVVFWLSLWMLPKYAVSLGANALFVGFLALTFIRLPHLTADYLREHAREEDTPAVGIILIVVVVVAASVVSLFLAVNSEKPDAGEVVASVASVLLGWFTVQALGALHYAYEFYQAPEQGNEKDGVEGGLDFPGEEEPDGSAFMYFSYTIGTSVATSDTKVTSNAMRRRVIFHIVFSHLYNTIILAAAVSVLTGLGGS